ncbi:MAG: biopolymer transporter ExbD [Rhizomicrobium sp.]|jgi:biopolymer transport protein ExbD
MAMNIGSGRNGNGIAPEINTTPLIDVMLVLLVMLIITIPMQTNAVKMFTGSGNPRATQTMEFHTLAIDFDGSLSWDGAPVANRRALETIFARIAHERDQAQVLVKPNRLASYGTVALILADAQNLGVRRIGFAGQEQYLR